MRQPHAAIWTHRTDDLTAHGIDVSTCRAAFVAAQICEPGVTLPLASLPFIVIFGCAGDA